MDKQLHELITLAHRALFYVKDSQHYLMDHGEAWGIAEDLEKVLKTYEVPCPNKFCNNGLVTLTRLSENVSMSPCAICNGKGTLPCPQ